MKKIKRLLCMLLSCLVLFAAVGPSLKVYAGDTILSNITSDSIKQKKKQISESEALKKTIKSSITDAKNLKKELESLKSDLIEYLKRLDSELSNIQANIENYKQLIEDKKAEIVEITAELEQAVINEENQYAAMKKRIKFMYEQGDYFYLEIVMNAASFGDLLTKADYIEKLEAYDRKMLEEYKDTREWTQLCKDTLEAEQEVLEEAERAMEEEEAAMEQLIAEKNIELDNYSASIKRKQSQIEDYEAELQAQTTVIETLEAEILAEQKKILEAKKAVVTYDGGEFTWPTPSYTRITDEFGYRTDPFDGSISYHSGIDIGAAGGTKILAAYDGVVVAAAWDWSMGNYVMINHGNGLYTIYMHSSKLLVKKDEVVVRGQHIANVGSTGRSTGNHLHFGVRLNGKYVSPWPYFGVNK